jgi:hypothetical protein
MPPDINDDLALPRLKFPMLDEPKRKHASLSPEKYEFLVRAFSTHPQARRSFLRMKFGRPAVTRPAEIT